MTKPHWLHDEVDPGPSRFRPQGAVRRLRSTLHWIPVPVANVSAAQLILPAQSAGSSPLTTSTSLVKDRSWPRHAGFIARRRHRVTTVAARFMETGIDRPM